jgi:5-methylcytosine-specific restriction endonuclease McrA
MEHACVDCGETDAVVLDFDHLRDKVNDVSSLVALRRPWEEVLEEIEKCEVRCANCHARKTARELGSYRTKIV